MKARNGILFSALCLSTIALAHGDGVESAGKVGDFEYLQVNTAIPEGIRPSGPAAGGDSDPNFLSIRKNRPGAGDPSAFSYQSDRPTADAKSGAGEGGVPAGQEGQSPSKENKELDWKNPMSAVVSVGNERGEVMLVEYGRNPETNRIEKIRINGRTEDVSWDLGTRKKLATVGGNVTMKAGQFTLKSLGSQQSAAPG